jgi:sporulation protein YlmC with PRC-barrel domain
MFHVFTVGENYMTTKFTTKLAAFAATIMLGVGASQYVIQAADVPGKSQLDQVDKVTQTHSVRASKIIGMEVRNEKGEKLGKVDELVIDTNTAKIRYAALSFGGFLGLGDKLFAIPWASLDCRLGKDVNDYYLVLATDPQVLKNSSGFDKDNWPDFGEVEFTKKIDQTFSRTR